MIQFSTRVTTNSRRRTYSVTFLVEHEGGNGPSLVGAIASLATDTNGGTASTVLVLSSRDGASGHRHG